MIELRLNSGSAVSLFSSGFKSHNNSPISGIF